MNKNVVTYGDILSKLYELPPEVLNQEAKLFAPTLTSDVDSGFVNVDFDFNDETEEVMFYIPE